MVDDGTLSFYVQLHEGQFADLEVVSQAAILWSQALKAAARAIDPEMDFRVTLVEAREGSSDWRAKVEQSAVNRGLEDQAKKWHATPLVVRVALGLVIAVPVTIVPAVEYYAGLVQKYGPEVGLLLERSRDALTRPAVDVPVRQLYRVLRRDAKIIGVGSGVPDRPNWKPDVIIPRNQFDEAEGLFLAKEGDAQERIIPRVLEVILVSPQLVNAPRSWAFKEEGLPSFRAIMRDKHFLAALDRDEIRESMRTKIQMTIALETRQRFVSGYWKDIPGGRSVVEVLSPRVGVSVVPAAH